MIDRAIVTLMSNRGLLLVGEPGTAKSMLSELLAAAISALTKSQVLAFIAATAVSFLFVMAGFDLVLVAVRSWAPPFIIDAVRSMSFLGNFQRIT